MDPKTHSSPAYIVSVIIVLSLCSCIFASIYQQQPISFVRSHEMLGLDCKDFIEASHRNLEHRNLYESNRFVTPPLAADLFSFFLSPFEFETSIRIFFFFNIAILITSLIIIHKSYSQKIFNESRICQILGLLILILSYPATFLIERGNIDGIVFLFVAGCLYFWKKNEKVAGVSLAIAVSLKIYPILLFFTACVEKRTRFLLSFLFVQCALIVSSFDSWKSFLFERILKRMDLFLWGDNMSFSTAHYFIREALFRLFNYLPPYDSELEYAKISGGITFFVLLSVTVYNHYRSYNRDNESITFWPYMYLPLMIAFPMQVYPYSQVLGFSLIFLYSALWNIAKYKKERIMISLLSILLGITFIHMSSLTYFFGNKLFFALPSISNLLMVVLLAFCSRRLYQLTISQQDVSR